MQTGSSQVFQGGSAQPLGILVVGAQSLTTFLGLGVAPLDAFPGLPLLRQQSLFSAFSPSAAKGCPGRLAGSGGRADRVQHPQVVSKMLGQGYEGRSWQSRTTDDSSFRSLPYFKAIMAGLHGHGLCLSSLRIDLQTQDKQKRKLRLMATSLCVCKMGMSGLW